MKINLLSRTIKLGLLAAMLPLLATVSQAQVNVGSSATPNSNAAVQVTSGGNKGLLLPSVALTGTANTAPLAGGTHVQGMVVYNTATVSDVCPGTYVNDGTKWIRMEGACPAPGILNGVTLATNQRYWVASVYDQNYLPYTAPTAPASITRPVAADGVDEATTVDYQGTISTTGVTVQIPITSVTGSGTVNAWSSTIVLPAAYSEDGTTIGTLQLSWASQTYTTSSTSITATIKSLNGTFNARKLDINAGIGNDYLGILLGAFQYPYNNTGTLTSYEVRDIPGIPDRMFGVADNTGSTTSHLMLYLPVQAEDGKIWLNNNLGADYANLNSASFNLTQQATAYNDYHAYGSVFQWGRRPDGHELIKYTSATSATPVTNSTVAYTTGVTNPNHSKFILGKSTFDGIWRDADGTQDTTLWMPTNMNNPCPVGFKAPNSTEMRNFVVIIENAFPRPPGAYTFNGLASSLKLPSSPMRSYLNGTMAYQNEPASSNVLWTSSAGTNDIAFAVWNNGTGIPSPNSVVQGSRKAGGLAVRCIQQ